jgi:Ca2+-binding RTX toxin-like protein
VLTIDGNDDDRVQLAEAWTAGVADGGYVNWTSENGETQATLRIDVDIQIGRVFIATEGVDSLVGGVTADTFLFTTGATLNEGDVAIGAAGIDTVELAGFGDFFDMRLLTLSDIELIRLVDGGALRLGDDGIDVVGSASDDFIELDAADLPASVDGGEGLDSVLLHLDGDDTVSGDAFSSIESIQLDGGGALTLEGFFLFANLLVQDDDDYVLTLNGASDFFVTLGGGADSIVAGMEQVEASGNVNAGGGNDTLGAEPLSGYGINLGDGDDLYVRSGASALGSVSGGDGIDTIQYAGAEAISVTLGSGDFEVLDAGGASGAISVSVFGSSFESQVLITTGSGNDSITLAWPGDAIYQQVHAGGGNDTVTTVDAGDDVALEAGDDTFNWEFGLTGLTGWTVEGGDGSDTLRIVSDWSGGGPLTLDFSTPQNVESAVLNFENLDAAGIDSLVFTVTAAAGGSIITTAQGEDQVFLGAGADVVATHLGNDSVTGALTEGDDIDLGDGDDTFELTGAVANGAQIDGGDAFGGNMLRVAAGAGDVTVELRATGSVFSNFHFLDGSEATGDIQVTADWTALSLSTGWGDDVLLIEEEGFSILFGDSYAQLGGGNDRAEWSSLARVDGGGGADTIEFTGSHPSLVVIDLVNGPFYIEFEHFDGAGGETDLVVRAAQFGSVIATGSGDDFLDSGAANDTLSGGLGNDVFRIDTAPGFGVDVITDFDPASDLLELLAGAFPGISGGVSLDTANFVAGPAAADADDYIVYDESTGNLYYDADANGAGAQVLFAVLSNQPALTAADIYVASF